MLCLLTCVEHSCRLRVSFDPESRFISSLWFVRRVSHILFLTLFKNLHP